MQQPYVFISYASANRERAERLAALLEGAGVSVWLDRTSIMGGTSWSAEIVRGIKGCAALVLLVSLKSVTSPNVQQEVQLAWENRRPLLPVLLEQCDLPDQVAYPLAGRQWVEVLDLPEEQWLPRALHALSLLGVAPGQGAAVSTEAPAPAAARPTAITRRHNLPTQLTEFIGREAELEELRTLVRANRLVTLTGAGGVGKTRLSLQAAEEMLDSFPDGVWLAELAPLTDSARVPQAVGAALELGSDQERPMLELLIQYLQPRQALLVLDNCEHVIAEAASLAQQLLRACPGLRVIATSREALGVTGEAIWRVPPLRVPDPHHLPLPSQMAEFDAIRLFINRASAVMPGFAVTYQNAPAIAQICQRLEGIPMAIELAAARVKVLSVEEIAERMDDIFRLLRGGSRTAPTRQQTLRALIDWSYDLLSEPERALWRRLSVFAGPFGMDAAEAICAGGDVEDWEVLDLLTALMDKSLVISHPGEGQSRYRLLMPLRQYGEERLAEAGEAEEVRGRHCDWYLKLAEQAAANWPGPNEVAGFDRLRRDYDNAVAALQWALTASDADRALRLANALGPYWFHAAYGHEAWRWISAALKLEGGPEGIRMSARMWRLNLAPLHLRAELGDEERAIVAWGEAKGDLKLVGWAKHLLAVKLMERGQLDEALAIAEEAVEAHRAGGDPYWLAPGMNVRAHVVRAMGRQDDAHELNKELWAFVRTLPPCPTVTSVLSGPFGSHMMQGDLETAEEIARFALGVVRHLRHHPAKGVATSWLAEIALRQGRPKESAALAREALGYLWADPKTHESLSILASISIFRVARALHEEGDTDRAIRLLGAIGDGIAPAAAWVAQGYKELVASLESTVEPPRYQRLRAEGKAMTLGQAVNYALMTT